MAAVVRAFLPAAAAFALPLAAAAAGDRTSIIARSENKARAHKRHARERAPGVTAVTALNL